MSLEIHEHQVLQKLLASTTKTIGDVTQAYEKLIDLFEDEYLAAGSHDINKYEKSAISKVEVSDLVLKKTQSFFSEYEQIASITRRESSFKSLTQVISFLVEITSLVIDNQATIRLLNKNLKAIRRLKSFFFEVKPKLEKNRLVLQRLLKNHQESYKFWQWAVATRDSSYDSKGPKVNKTALSQIQVKV